MHFNTCLCYVRLIQNQDRGWEDDSVGKVLTLQAWESESNPQNKKKQSWAWGNYLLEKEREVNSWASQPSEPGEFYANERCK